MARYALVLKQDEATWLRIIFKPLLTPKQAMEGPTILKEFKISDVIIFCLFSFVGQWALFTRFGGGGEM